MKVKLFLIASVITLVISVVYIAGLLNQDFVLNKESKYKSTINVWTTTPELSTLLTSFQSQTNIKVNVKQFQNSKLLMEELELTKINNNTPDIVEVSSLYEINNVKDNHTIYPLESLVRENIFHQSITDSFSYKNTLYAYPLGIEVPTMYVNHSFINKNSHSDLYPFQSEKYLQQYKELQQQIDNKSTSKPFWLFHFDNQVAWYWNAYKLSSVYDSTKDFKEIWNDLIKKYKLLPPLDNRMAITRFANFEVGALVSSSEHLQSIQQLIGNSFELEVYPFIVKPTDKILVSGKGLVVLTDKTKEEDNLKQLFQFLNTKDVQLDLLSKTGWLPSQQKLLDSALFIHDLPMSKYLSKLTEFEKNFVGNEFSENSESQRKGVQNTVNNTEMK